MTKPYHRFFKWFVILLSSFTCFFLIEIGFRQWTTKDVDQNTWFRQRMLRPYNPPNNRVSQNVKHYLKTKTTPLISYHSTLGWIPSPHYTSANGPYHHNADGRRTTNPSSPIKTDTNALTIALFGDSYIYGDEVTFTKTIGHQLKEILATHGINANIMNYGVGAYGMDQAYLRWKYVSNVIQPDIVLFGFQA